MTKFLILTAAAFVLVGCAATPSATTATTAATTTTTAAAPADKAIVPTGSRIPYRSTERLTRTIGAETFKNDDGSQIKSITNVTGARGN